MEIMNNMKKPFILYIKIHLKRINFRLRRRISNIKSTLTIKINRGTFWHIISTGSDEANRIPDLRRYERIAWPAHILGYCKQNCDKLLIWKNKRKGKSRILLWCIEIDYLVVLDERKDYCLFWTAYPVERRHTKEKLMKEYKEYMSSSKI